MAGDRRRREGEEKQKEDKRIDKATHTRDAKVLDDDAENVHGQSSPDGDQGGGDGDGRDGQRSQQFAEEVDPSHTGVEDCEIMLTPEPFDAHVWVYRY